MFLSNNSSTSLNNNNNNNNYIDQQPMFDRPFFINDVSPSSKMYPAPPPIHDQYSSPSSFSNTFNSDHHHHHHHHHQNSSEAADDQDFIAAFLLQQQQHQDQLLVGHQFSQIQQQNTSSTTTTTSSGISKQTEITDYQTNLTHLNNNMINMEMISNKNVVDEGGINRREPAAAVTLWKKKTSTTTSKKDRHSKIVTAQGPRDRRMRLSLEIARRFFNLQDMLGFDKASKTVEWLLTKSKGAIKELSRSIKGSSNTSGVSGSSTSECEVVSVLDHTTPNVVVVDDDDENKVQISNTISSKRVRVNIRKPTFHPPPLAKDSRAKARARARERTIEKMRSRSTAAAAPFPHNINQLTANSCSYETGGEESGSQSHDMRSTSLEMVAEVEDHTLAAARSPSLECQGPTGEDYSFVITRNSPTTTSPFIDYNHEIKTSQGLNLNNNNNNNCNFPENWDIDSGRAHSTYYSMANNMHLSTTDFQFVSKPWIT